jgi:hypothetical protein
VAYDVSPGARGQGQFGAMLLKSGDGVRYETLVGRLFTEGGPTEATIRFAADGTAYCLLRRDGKPSNTAVLGTSKAPHREWTWKDLGKFLGGPELMQIPDGRWIAGGRLHGVGSPAGTRTALCELKVESGELEPILVLPSGGDSSYPGFVWHEGHLWASYYSSHEGRTSIYLAKAKF